MNYSKRNLVIAGAIVLAIIVIIFIWFSITPNQPKDNTTGTATSTTATSTTATTTDVKTEPASTAASTTPAKPGQSAPVKSGIPDEKLTQYWNLFKQGGRCAHVGAPKGTAVYSFSGEGIKVSYDGTSPLVKCAVDGNLYVK